MCNGEHVDQDFSESDDARAGIVFVEARERSCNALLSALTGIFSPGHYLKLARKRR